MKEKETETKTMTQEQKELIADILTEVIPQIKNTYTMEDLIKKFS